MPLRILLTMCELIFFSQKYLYTLKQDFVSQRLNSFPAYHILVFSFDHFTKSLLQFFWSLLGISLFEFRCHRQIEVEEPWEG